MNPLAVIERIVPIPTMGAERLSVHAASFRIESGVSGYFLPRKRSNNRNMPVV